MSEAVKVVIETVSEVAVDGIANAVTVGAVASTVTEALLLGETLPAASLAQA